MVSNTMKTERCNNFFCKKLHEVKIKNKEGVVVTRNQHTYVQWFLQSSCYKQHNKKPKYDSCQLQLTRSYNLYNTSDNKHYVTNNSFSPKRIVPHREGVLRELSTFTEEP